MASKKFDNSWGSARVPLLPHSLRVAWAGEEFPKWVRDELGVAEGATIGALDDRIWAGGATTLSERVRNFLLNLVSARRTEIKPLQVFQQPWPYWLDPKDLGLSTRTRHCLGDSGLLSEFGAVVEGNLWNTFRDPVNGGGVNYRIRLRC